LIIIFYFLYDLVLGKKIYNTAIKIGNEISTPLKEYYEKILLKEDSPLLYLKPPKEENISNQNLILHPDIAKEIVEWAEYPEQSFFFTEETVKKAKNTFSKFDFEFPATNKSKINRYSVLGTLYQQVAQKLGPIFNKVITDLYLETMNKIDNDNENNNDDIKADEIKVVKRELANVHFVPIKTVTRALQKADEYRCIPSLAGVKDWVQIELFCETPNEMILLFNNICKLFENHIVKSKNSFMKDDTDVKFHCRNITINTVFDGKKFDKTCNNNWKMIVEIQLILKNYLPIREKMQFCYEVVRYGDNFNSIGAIAGHCSNFFELPD